jgi:putative cardiolipin synthase
MGLVIESPALAQRLASALDRDSIGRRTYEVQVASDGHCPVWVEHAEGGEVFHDVEPATSASQRALIELLELLPIEWLL